jgi:transposase
LSHQGQDISALMSIFKVSRITVYNWFNRWDKYGLIGLYNEKGQGRKTILTDSDIEKVKERVRENRQQLKVARVQLKEDLSKEFSDKTLKRFLKNLVANGIVSENP